MSKYALIEDESALVVNIIEWSGDSNDWSPPGGHTALELQAGDIPFIGGTFEGGEFRPPTPASVSLEEAQAARFAAIDARTDQLTALGFTFDDKQFSLALTAQLRLMSMYTLRSEADFTYPVRINTVDDTAYLDLKNADDVSAMFLAGVAALRAAVDSGTALKDQVRAATTVDEVAAVEDTR